MNRLTNINKILLFIILLFAILYFAGPHLVPFTFGIFLAFLVTPLCNYLESIKINRIIASIISTMVIFIVLGAILFLFAYQMNSFVEEISSFRNEIQSFIDRMRDVFASMTKISPEDQTSYLNERSDQLIDRIETQVTQFVSGLINSLFSLLLVLVYVILFLLFRDRIYQFILMYIPKDKIGNTQEVLTRISKVAFQYLWGRAQVMMLLAIMYYIVFLIFDLPYAGLLIIFGTLITIIPYFGPFVSGLLPIIVSFIFFENLHMAILFTAIVISVQLIESYVLEPLIIGKEVKLNPLVVIVAVVIGGAVWGIAGMVLFVPLFAIFQIISMHTVGLEPIGFLLGDKQANE